MPDLKPIIALTSSTNELKLSRHNLLDWVNATVHGQYNKVEELCSGIAYCQLTELLFPNSIIMKKLKLNPRLEHEYLHNLKMLQAAFTRLKIDKAVPIERLIKGRFQDNLEFLQWFKKFFDTYAAGKDNLKLPAALAAAAANAPKPIRKPSLPTVVKSNPVGALNNGQQASASDKGAPNESTAVLQVLQKNLAQLKQQTIVTETERDYAYNKLVAIESLIKAENDRNPCDDWSKRILGVLYASDNNDEDQSSVEY